jgi:hypothetical protein
LVTGQILLIKDNQAAVSEKEWLGEIGVL